MQLIGLVETEVGKIEGMITSYIGQGRSLCDIETVSREEYTRWADQIRSAIEYLHGKGLVWGDAKSANILIGGDRNAVLVDFGGGYTDKWVDKVNHDTPCGDLQGLDRVLAFMKERLRQDISTK